MWRCTRVGGDCRRKYEHLDDPVRCLVDCLDYRLLGVSRGRRVDPPVARAGRDLIDHPLCGRRKDGLSGEIERIACPRGLNSRPAGAPLYSHP